MTVGRVQGCVPELRDCIPLLHTQLECGTPPNAHCRRVPPSTRRTYRCPLPPPVRVNSFVHIILTGIVGDGDLWPERVGRVYIEFRSPLGEVFIHPIASGRLLFDPANPGTCYPCSFSPFSHEAYYYIPPIEQPDPSTEVDPETLGQFWTVALFCVEGLTCAGGI